MLCNEKRLLDLMDKFGLDGVVASTPENVFYLSGFSSWKQVAYRYDENSHIFVVCPRDTSQPAALIIPGGEEGYTTSPDVWIREIFMYGKSRKPKISEGTKLSPEETGVISLVQKSPKGVMAEEVLSRVVQEKGLGKARLGIDEYGLLPGMLDKIKACLPNVEILPAYAFFHNVRMVKTSAEIARLQHSAAVNQRAANAVLKQARPGVTEGELAGIYRAEVGRAGGHVSWLHLAFGRAGNYQPTWDRIIKEDEILRTDAGCFIQGYNADTCRSGCLGKPGDKHKRVFGALQAGVLKSVELLKPGVLPSELFDTMIQGIRSAGLPSYANSFAGHTIGLEAREFPFVIGPVQELHEPFLPPTTDIPLEPGMTVNLEASTHEYGWGSVAVEYSLVITDKGYEHLIPPDQAFHALPLV